MPSQTEIPVYFKITIIAVGVLACSYILVLGQSIIVPLLYATLFAILLHPAVSFLTGKKLNRIIAIAITMTVALAFLAGLLYLLVWQAQTLSSTFPKFQEKFFLLSANTVDWMAAHLHLSAAQINAWIDNMRTQMLDNSGSYIGQTFSALGVMVAGAVILPVYIFMLLYYQPLILEFIRQLFSKEYHTSVAQIMAQIRTIVQSYLRGLMIEMVIVAVLNCIALLALGVEYAILLGIIGAVLNLIPYLGGIVAVLLPMIVAMVNQDPLHVFLVLGAYALIQFIDNNFLMPKVVASKVKVNALISIIGVLIGGALWGIAGMFLSIPLLAVIKIVCDHVDYLKPWGYLLGDTMPPLTIVETFMQKARVKKQVEHK